MNKPTPFSRWRYWTRFHLPNLIYLLLLVALAAGSYWWIKNEGASAKKNPEKHPEMVDAFAEGLTINRTNKDGSIGYVLTAKDIVHYGSKDGAGKTVTLVATPIGQPPMTAVAREGAWSDDTHTIKLTGDVKMTRASADGGPEMVLVSDAIDIDMYGGMASTTLPFKWTQGKSEVTGTGFDYDYDLRNLKLSTKTPERIHAIIYGYEIKK